MPKRGEMKYARRMTNADWEGDPFGRNKENAPDGVYLWISHWTGPFRCSNDAMNAYREWLTSTLKGRKHGRPEA